MLFRTFSFIMGSSLILACSSSSPSSDDAGQHPTEASPKDARRDVQNTTSDATIDGLADAHVTKDVAIDAKIVDAGPPPYDGPVYTLEAGISWTSLYRDYFANTKTASCSAQSFCHGAPSDHGAEVSLFVCPGNDASAACYAGITSQEAGVGMLVTPDASFADDLLSQVLCNEDGGGSMPYNCTYTFTKVDFERLNAWVTAGAHNN